MDIAQVPMWEWWVVAGVAAVLLLGGGGYLAGYFIYRRLSRRYLVKVVGGREGVAASRRTLETVMQHLSDVDDEKLQLFAAHPEDEDRKTLSEVSRRMEIVTEELDTMPLPRSLWPAAEALADAAYVIGEEAGRVGESDDPGRVFPALADVDIARVCHVFEYADNLVREACERFDLDEAAVYGGGLYI